jgi:DNA replication and repair protein RecF
LLLDDVSSELDATRNEYLFEFLERRPTQCFITTTHPRHVLLSRERVDYRVEGGVVTQQTP